MRRILNMTHQGAARDGDAVSAYSRPRRTDIDVWLVAGWTAVPDSDAQRSSGAETDGAIGRQTRRQSETSRHPHP